MFPNSQYGSPQAYYGNIQLGAISFPVAVYGAWPSRRPRQKEMLTGDWQEPEVHTVVEVPVATYAQEIGDRSAIIRELTERLNASQDAAQRQLLAEQRKVEREAMQRAARIKNMVDDEEALFILH